MKFLGLSLLASVALAAPAQLEARGNSQPENCDNPGRVISIILDSSGSTATSDHEKLRIAGGKDLVDYLTSASEATDKNKADTVSVVSFDSTPKVEYPQGDANEQAKKALDGVDSSGGTNIAKGLTAGIEQVAAANPGNRGGVIIFTDGLDSNTDGIVKQINKAKEAGIRVSWGHTNSPYKGGGSGLIGGILGGITNLITGGLNAMSGESGKLDQRISEAVLASGGTASIISNSQSQREFVQQVIKNGLTNNDGKCGGNDIGESGGPLINDVTTLGLCSKNAQAVFTYSPKSQHEQLTFAINLVSQNSPVNIQATYTNKATGQTSTVTVNKGQASGALQGEANPGEQVEVVINTSNADSNACQYSTVTNTVTQTATVTGPAPSSTVCICKCDAPGAKPMPKFEL
ncbi:hypothetical protein A1Q2_00125 [Trichosporon asahii var. asahii CBS 8904]|uniref:VWFA domain-containing protein n=1 Tax=Trichosporon asahii var. asahii (strain CBS 8904) TaxID=1220162 RepID=K1VN07_TRIAC|nr:hypothetical protein A1Q2_00125 [Trichosporon asahii var. asahii CBS 8904]